MSAPSPDDGTVEGHYAGPLGELLAIARAVLAEPGLTADEELTGRGATSLSLVRIIMEASISLQLDIDPRDLSGTVTVRNLARIAMPQPPN